MDDSGEDPDLPGRTRETAETAEFTSRTAISKEPHNDVINMRNFFGKFKTPGMLRKG